jgi:hypothetical protein
MLVTTREVNSRPCSGAHDSIFPESPGTSFNEGNSGRTPDYSTIKASAIQCILTHTLH